MKKLLVLFASVSVLALAGCGEGTPPAEAPKTEAPAAPAADAAKPAEAPAADAAKPAEGDAAKPADGAAAPADGAAAPAAGGRPAEVQAQIDALKTTAATMTDEQKTQALAGIKSAAEAAATAAGQDAAAAGTAAETAAKAALGM